MPIPASILFLTSLFDSTSAFQPRTTSNQDESSPISHGRRTLNPSLPTNSLLQLENDDPQEFATLKRLLTTLHLFFPAELLPALDLLDRGLVTKLVPGSMSRSGSGFTATDRIQHSNDDSTPKPPADMTHAAARGEGRELRGWYVVRSSSSAEAVGSRSHGSNQHYSQHQPQPQFSPRRADQSDTRYSRGSGARGISYEVRLGAWNCTCPAFAFDFVNSLTGGVESWNGSDDQRERQRKGIKEAQGTRSWIYGGMRMGKGVEEPEAKVPMCKHLLACLLLEKCPLFGGKVVERKVSVEEMAGWAAGWGD